MPCGGSWTPSRCRIGWRRIWSCSSARINGTLANNRRRREYAQLRDDEVRLLEDIVRDAFDGFNADAGVTAGEGGRGA